MGVCRGDDGIEKESGKLEKRRIYVVDFDVGWSRPSEAGGIVG